MRQDMIQAVLEFSTLAAQALLAAVLGLVLLGLFRHYRRTYLAHWSFSWLALAFFLILSSVARAMAMADASLGAVRIAASTVALVAGYLQLAWLLLGAREIATGRVVPRPWARWVLILSAVLATLLVLASMGPGSTLGQRLVLRYGLRSLAAGITFLVVAACVRWGSTSRGGARTALIASLVLYGLTSLEQFALIADVTRAPPWAPYIGFLEIVLIATTGFGTVFGLLQEERSRATRASEEIEHLAYHDPVTGRPNRRLFADRVSLALAQAQRNGQLVAVLFVNLDRFKNVNDSLGHGQGDELLRAVGDRLERSVRAGDTVARVDGDEFGLLLAPLQREDDAGRIARTLLDELRRPFMVWGREVYLSGSIGASLYPGDGPDPASLLRGADTALRNAKQQGRDRVVLYSPQMNARAAEQLAIEASLRQALVNEEFVLHYQPVVDLASGDLTRFEALVRWQHPERGCLMPGEFLPLVERIGLSEALDFWVLRRACRQVRAWHDAGWPVSVAVNVSARPFQNPDLVAHVAEALRETRVEARYLEFEITETMAMLNPEASRDAMVGLRALGVRIAIDDFGTGYSSLSYLRGMPVDSLKIDRSFVRDLARDSDAAAVAKAIITLAHSLRLDVIAEGVETEEQRVMLGRHGCDQMQGFLIGRAVPAEQCGPLLATRLARVPAPH